MTARTVADDIRDPIPRRTSPVEIRRSRDLSNRHTGDEQRARGNQEDGQCVAEILLDPRPERGQHAEEDRSRGRDDGNDLDDPHGATSTKIGSASKPCFDLDRSGRPERCSKLENKKA